MNPLASNPTPPLAPVVLIVDDFAGFRNLLRKRLDRDYPGRFQIREAASALAAQRLLEQVPIAVVIADLDMPGMSGTDFLDLVGERWPDAKRLLLTGFASGALVVSAPYAVLSKQLAGWLICDRIAELAGIR